MKTILCYGDSNTWGYVAGSRDYETMYVERYDRNTRWPGLLQKKLGDEFYVVEEGLNGRTTNLDDPIPPDRNGKNYLPSCLYTHAPIDLVILALGGNDLKTCYKRKPVAVSKGLEELIEIIQNSQYGANMLAAPEILVISQPIPLPISETFSDDHGVKFFEGGVQKAEELVDQYSRLARRTNCHFLDVSQEVIPSSLDGVHLDKGAHQKMAQMIYQKVLHINGWKENSDQPDRGQPYSS